MGAMSVPDAEHHVDAATIRGAPPSGALPAREIERFVVEGGARPALALLVRARLAGHAYANRGADGDEDGELQGVVQRLTMRHLRTKAVLLPLLRRLRERALDAVPFKGFHLAEFVYDDAAARPYGDVDVLVRPEQADAAIACARDLGWRVRWSRRESLYRYSHEEAVLERDGVTIELHRLAIDCASPDDARQRRITDQVWRNVERVPWQGTDLGLLDPADAALVGIVLARMWSGGDDLQLKATDYLDLRALGARHGLDLQRLRLRARSLGCEQTLEAFVRRCDPWSARLSLAAPGPAERRALFRTMTPERGSLPRERLFGKVRRLPGTVVDVLRHAPLVVRWARRLRRSPGVGDVVFAAAPPGQAALRLADKERVVRGVKWGARLMTRGDACVLRSVALVDALRRRGGDAHLVSGRDTEGRWHAWVELEPFTLSDLEDVATCEVAEVGVRSPTLRP